MLDRLNTLPGDLDANGEVAFMDFLTIANNFGKIPATYVEGNIDLGEDGVAFLDFLELANNFGKTPSDVASVPEPRAIASILSCLLLTLAWQRKKRSIRVGVGSSK